MSGMKTKTIKSVLRRKMDRLLESVECDKLREDMQRDVVITGGAIASMLLGEKVNDYDIYFRTRETTEAVAKYYVDRFIKRRIDRGGVVVPIYVESEPCKVHEDEHRVRIVAKSAGIDGEGGEKDYQYFEMRPPQEAGEYVSEIMDDPGKIAEIVGDTHEQVLEQDEGEPYRPIFLSTNAITLSGKVQIILRFFGEPDQLHANYDFVHCTNYWLSGENELILRPEALEALLSKTLIYSGSRYPVCSLMRIRKFIQRGWTINAGQILKAAMQISKLDLEDLDVLEDQLTGVDAAYFAEVIAKAKEGGATRIESAYLVEIIERIFQ